MLPKYMKRPTPTKCNPFRFPDTPEGRDIQAAFWCNVKRTGLRPWTAVRELVKRALIETGDFKQEVPSEEEVK